MFARSGPITNVRPYSVDACNLQPSEIFKPLGFLLASNGSRNRFRREVGRISSSEGENKL